MGAGLRCHHPQEAWSQMISMGVDKRDNHDMLSGNGCSGVLPLMVHTDYTVFIISLGPSPSVWKESPISQAFC